MSIPAELLKYSEKEWQKVITSCAEFNGWSYWHNPDSRRCNPGLPDLMFLREGTGQMFWVEVKKEKGKLTERQKEVLEALEAADQEVYVWRPSDWDIVRERLCRKHH